MDFGRLAVAVKADFVVDDLRSRTVLVAEVELSTSAAKRFRAGIVLKRWTGFGQEDSSSNVSFGNPLETGVCRTRAVQKANTDEFSEYALRLE